MVRQRLTAGDEKAQEPLESDTHSATHATQRNPLHQQALNQSPRVIREEMMLLKAFDKLAPAVLTSMVLLPVVNVTISLILRRSTPWARLPDDQGFLLTSPPLVSVVGQQ
jgi:hypothetical protein